MKTQCPKCQQINEVTDGFKGRTVTCSFCEHVFTAESTVEAMLGKTDTGRGIPRKPGDTWYTVSYLAGALGGLYVLALLFGSNAGAALITLVSTVIFCLLAVTLGGILNRLEEITRHIELLREEIRKQKSD